MKPALWACIAIATTGLYTGAAPPGSVGSVFGRTGQVRAQFGDYNFSQIAGQVLPSQLPPAAALPLPPPTSSGRVLVAGPGITLTDDATNNTITISMDSSILSGMCPVLASSNMYAAGASQIFISSATSEGIRLIGAVRPTSPRPGALNMSLSGDLEWFDGAVWRMVTGK